MDQTYKADMGDHFDENENGPRCETLSPSSAFDTPGTPGGG